MPTKCVTPGASSKGAWFPTEFYFKATVLRGVKFLLWKTLSPVDSQVSTRAVLPPPAVFLSAGVMQQACVIS